ncbi:hypothetical protein GCM10028807_17350 [Spirosoma daeguense]
MNQETTLTNHDGFLIDQAGVIRGLEIPISPEPVTGFSRIARHDSLYISKNLQMIQRVEVVKLDANGKELSQAFRETELNPNVMAQMLQTYQSTVYTASTENAYVNRSTGQAVEAGNEGAVEQLAFFQGITIGVLKAMGKTIGNGTSVPGLVYGLLLAEIQKLDAQGRL